MPGKARPGKIKNHSSAKKRFKKTGKGLFAQQKAAHNHLLQQKSKRQKRLANKTIITDNTYGKMLKRMLPN
ncbi:MAG: 50S ribosomal protein L35 [Candidatus Peregrinibacteria bacterium]